MLTVATCFWQPNANSYRFSRMYTEEWVDRLYRGFKRNLSDPFEFVCFTDRERKFKEPIIQERIRSENPDYGTFIEPYRLGVPMVLCGLDTVVTGNCDALAEYCFTAEMQALPRDPYKPHRACNGVALVPAGWAKIAEEHRGENDMDWVRKFPHKFIDDEFPGQVKSYKGHIKKRGLGDVRIAYFHGEEKPHQLGVEWIRESWR